MSSAAVDLPEVLGVQSLAAANAMPALQLLLRVPESLAWFDGHFAGQPILPGVVQAHWALEFARRHFALPAVVRSLHNIKFMQIIRPGDTLTLRLRHDTARQRLSFDYCAGEVPCASGTLQLAA